MTSIIGGGTPSSNVSEYNENGNIPWIVLRICQITEIFIFRTELFRNKFFSNETGGVNQGNVSSKFVENIKLPFPTLPEQQEIVRLLDDLFAKEQNAKDLCDLEALAGPGNGKNHAVNPYKYRKK